MTKKSFILLLVALGLATTYAYYFTDWINPPLIQIYAQVRPLIQGGQSSRAFATVIFTLDGKYNLTSVELIPVSGLATNRHPTPLWNLVRYTNTPPVHGFAYGASIRGLRPVIPQSRPEPLELGVNYRLLVAAGRARGHIDFKAQPPSADN
jgi:hypothetical protein